MLFILEQMQGLQLDEDGLTNLLVFCSSRPEFCKEGGKMDDIASAELHKAGFKRIEVYFMVKILRKCLDDIELCDIEQTVLAMESILRVSDNVAVSSTTESEDIEITGDKDKKRFGMKEMENLKLYFPQYFNKNADNKALYMFSRHGRKFNKWLHGRESIAGSLRTKRSLASDENVLSRRKRTALTNIFNGMIRNACSNTNDCKDHGTKLPGYSSI